MGGHAMTTRHVPSLKHRSGPRKIPRSPAAESAQLIIPALRCKIGTWVYYAAAMRFADVAERVHLAQDIHQSGSLNDLIQRALDRRAGDISEYLVKQRRERFFNAIVVGVYGGEPEWLDLRVEDNQILNPSDIPEYVKESLGILRLSGAEQLFALDGQHRVVGIREAIKQDDALGNEQLTALFVSHSRTRPGLERTRRLFTTLNRYAKPVNKKDVIALDEDDTVAIVTRKLVDSHQLFRDKISVMHTKSMPASARDQFTSIVALYDALDIYLRSCGKMSPREWTKFKRFRPTDEVIQKNFVVGSAIFDGICKYFEEVREMRDSPSGSAIAGKYRNKEGGNLLFRPIGLSILMRTLAFLRNDGLSENTALMRISRVPMQLSRGPWLGLLWDSDNRRMIVRSENQTAATRILYYGAGGDLRHMKTTAAKLGDELKGLLGSTVRILPKRYGKLH